MQIECGEQQRCKCTPQAIGHCSSNEYGASLMEGDYFNHYPELLLQSRLETLLYGS